MKQRDNGARYLIKKLVARVFKAIIITAMIGACFMFFWLIMSATLARWFPEYQMAYVVLAWATVFFTFVINVTHGTIFKYFFVIGRALFLIVYVVLATNGGVMTMDFMNYSFTLDFVPLLALMIVVSLLAMVRGVLQAIEFTSESNLE